AFENVYKELAPLNYNIAYLFEAGFGVEIIRYARSFDRLVQLSEDKETGQEEIDELVEKLKNSAESYFKNYQLFIDKEVFTAMMSAYYNNVDKNDMPGIIISMYDKYKGDFEKMAEEIFDKSIFASEEKMKNFLEHYKRSKYKKIVKEPVYKIAQGLTEYYHGSLMPGINSLRNTTDSLMRIYMKAQMEMQPKRKFYPDANFTLRVAYGNIESYKPGDAVSYNYFTTLEGIMQKEDPDIYDYVVEDKLKELYNNKDYGKYADKDGSMHVCFIANNHTSGGNSGSPVLDADGNLIGINFDRCWEGTMSDIIFDGSQCRNITLDIRYCLFIIDKFAGATHLIEEMTIVE
nr:S46 family peptidase [Bacteroidota bacterium]